MKAIFCSTLLLFSVFCTSVQADPFKEALTLDRQGFYQETLPHWKAFLASHPEKKLDVYGHIKLCIIMNRMGNLGQAFEVAKRLAERYPDDFHAQFNLGNMTSAVKKFPEAVQAYQTAIKMHPEEGLGHIGLGLSLFGDRKTEKSLNILRNARSLFKKQKNISWHQNTRIMIGQIKSFAPYPPDFSDLWLNNNLKTIRDTYHRTLFIEYEKELNL